MAANQTSFQKGQSGNPAGKRLGSRNHATRMLDELMDGEAEAIGRAAIAEGKNGNPAVLKLNFDRIAPPRKDRHLAFALPPIETSADLTRATGALLAAVAEGSLTPSEATELGKLVDSHVKAIEATDIQERLTRLEAQKGIGATPAETEPQNSDAFQRGVTAGLEIARDALKRGGAPAETSDRVTP